MARSLRHARDASPVDTSRPKKAAGGLYKTAAIKVLEAENRFMRSGEITKVAQKMGFFKECTGKTPEHTMASCLYQEIKKGKKSNIFRPIGPSGPEPGLFGLRGWTYVPEDTKEEAVVPKRAKRPASVSVSDYSEEEDVYVPKRTTARTKKRSVPVEDECTNGGTAPETPLVWRSSRARKRARWSDTEDAVASAAEEEKYAGVPDEQMRAHIDLLLEAACELEETVSGLASAEEQLRPSTTDAMDVESETSASREDAAAAAMEDDLASPSRAAEDLPSTSSPKATIDTPRTSFTKVFSEVFQVPRGPPEPTRAKNAAAPPPAVTSIAPVTPSTSDSHGDQQAQPSAFPASTSEEVMCRGGDPSEATSLKEANLPAQPAERKGSVNNLSVELPFAEQQENCATTPNPVTPELFCRSLSTGSLPTAPAPPALTKSYSTLAPTMLLPKIRV